MNPYKFIPEFNDKVKNSKESLLERCLSYTLFYLSLLSLGVHLKALIGQNKKANNTIAVDFYVIGKVLLSVLAAIFGWYTSADGTPNVLFWIIVWFTFETIIYNLLHILCHNLFEHLNLFKRNIILGLLNYFEIVFNFSIFYAALKLVRESCSVEVIPKYNWIDYLYFSMGSGGIIAYGNYTIYSDLGKLLVILQCILFLMFFSLFVTYNISLFMESKANKAEKIGGN